MRNLKQSSATPRAEHDAMLIDDLLAAASIVRTLVRRAQALTETGDFPQTMKAAAVLKKSFESELEKNLIAAYEKLPAPQANHSAQAASEQAE